jgi:hypothetical protein
MAISQYFCSISIPPLDKVFLMIKLALCQDLKTKFILLKKRVLLAEILLSLFKALTAFIVLLRVIIREETSTVSQRINLQKSVTIAERKLPGQPAISMLKKPFVITIAWLNGSPKITGKKIIQGGTEEIETQGVVDGSLLELKPDDDPRESVKFVRFKPIPSIIKFL